MYNYSGFLKKGIGELKLLTGVLCSELNMDGNHYDLTVLILLLALILIMWF